MAEFEHPTTATKDVHLVQSVIYQLPVRGEPQMSITEVTYDAKVGYSLAKKTLEQMNCASLQRSGGPRATRSEEEPKTVIKVFDAVTEPAEQGSIPSRCVSCPFSNSHQRTEFRNRPTSGCVILGIRKSYLPPENIY